MVIDLYKDVLGVDQDVVFYGWVCLVIEQFFASINRFGAWRKDFNND